MQNIVPCQLSSYFALLYNMITIEQIFENKASPNNAKNKNFKQKLKFPCGQIITTYLPPFTAPNSVIQFWCNQLKLQDDETVNSYLNQGYSSTYQVMAEVNGYYSYYIGPRFVKKNFLYILYIIFILNLYNNNVILLNIIYIYI